MIRNVIFTGSDRTSYYRPGPAINGPGQSRPVRTNPVAIPYRDEATSGGRGGGIFRLWAEQTALKKNLAIFDKEGLTLANLSQFLSQFIQNFHKNGRFTLETSCLVDLKYFWQENDDGR